MGGRLITGLTQKEIDAAAAEARRTGARTSIGCGGGIYLEVNSAGRAVIYGRLRRLDGHYKAVKLGLLEKGGMSLARARAQLAELRSAAPPPPAKARPVHRRELRDIRSYPPFEPGTIMHGVSCYPPNLDPTLWYLGAKRVQFDLRLDSKKRKQGRGVISLREGYMIMRLIAAPIGTLRLDHAATQREARAYARAAGLPRRAVGDIMRLCYELMSDPLIRMSLDGALRGADWALPL